MNKKILIIFLVFSFFLLNFSYLKAFYNNFLGKELYENKKYKQSEELFEKSFNIFGSYNKANSLYKQKKYVEAIKEYKSILSDKKNYLNFRIYHNLGNSFYRLGELEKNSSKKISYYKEAVDNYLKALKIKYDDETKKNLDFVLKKIQEEKEKKNKQQKEEKEKQSDSKNQKSGNQEKKQDSKNNGEGQKKDSKNNGEGQKDNKNSEKAGENQEKQSDSKKQKSGNQEKKQDSKNNSKGQKKDDELNQEQLQALKAYEENLKKEQFKNSKDYGKVYKENTNPFDDFDDFFGRDPFFDNSLIDDFSNDKKDW